MAIRFTLRRAFLVPAFLFSSVCFSAPAYDAAKLFDLSGNRGHYAFVFEQMPEAVLDAELESEEVSEPYVDQFNSAALEALEALTFEDKLFVGEWFETPLGKKMAFAHANPKSYLLADAAKSVAIEAQRKALIYDIVDRAELVDISLRIGLEMAKSMVVAVNTVENKDLHRSIEDVELMQTKHKEQFAAAFREHHVDQLTIAYKAFNEDELQQVATFVGRESYLRFSNAVHDAFIDVAAVAFYFQGLDYADSIDERTANVSVGDSLNDEG